MSVYTRGVEPVHAVATTSTAEIVTLDTGRLRGVVLGSDSAAGSAVFLDGGTSGSEILTLHSPAAIGLHSIEIPGGGILFTAGLSVVLNNVESVTAIYGEGN